jgi:hypothetical protein
VGALGRPRFGKRDGRLFGQTLVGLLLLSKTVISRASLTLCFISGNATERPSRALWRDGEKSVWLLAKTVVSRASLDFCFISGRATATLRARPARMR